MPLFFLFDLFLEARAEILLIFWSIWRHQNDISKLTDLYIVIKCYFLGILRKKYLRLMWLFFFSGKHDLWRAQTCWTHGRHRDSLFDFLRFCPKPQWECLQVCINQLCKSYNVQYAHYGNTGYGVRGKKFRMIFAWKSTCPKKLLNFESWCRVELSKIRHHFSTKVILKLNLSKNVLLNWYSSMKKLRKILMIFDIKNWLWTSNFGTFWHLPTTPIHIVQYFPLNVFIFGQKSF